MKYNFKNLTILSGKVLVLLSVVFIFSYVNIYYDKLEKAEFEKSKKDNDMEYSRLSDTKEKFKDRLKEQYKESYDDVMEGFASKEDRIEYYREAKNGKCILQLSSILKLPLKILGFLVKGIIWLAKFLYRPIQFILKSLLGKYFDVLVNIFKVIYIVYEKIVYYFFLFLRLLVKIVYAIIDVIFRLFFAIIPNIILNLLSIILSLPLIIFVFLKPFFKIFNFLKVICWSRNGIVYDLRWLRNKILDLDLKSILINV